MPLLFSYGTLQQEGVQLATFHRRLTGYPDELIGYERSFVRIDEEEVVAASGRTHHPIVRPDGRPDSRVAGPVFEISDDELALADRYEVDAYRRISARLASGRTAWVYVDAGVEAR